ncbi:MAG: leucine-rich repeat domain-containing protein [Ruminococcaceae bacterium]|nr:leucine-rich repeat domain-containing protein [Oscillospiraceae bacterium]
MKNKKIGRVILLCIIIGCLVLTLGGCILMEDKDKVEPQHEHEYGEWMDYTGNGKVYCESKLFYRICNECSNLEWKQGAYENHRFDTVTFPPTCSDKGFDEKTCSICGFVEKANETDTLDHTWKTEYLFDNTYHWFKCKYCTAIDFNEEHNLGSDGTCTVCDTLIPTKGLIYTLSLDDTYAVTGYDGSATYINIPDEYEGKPVTRISSNAFYDKNKIVSVVIPDSVTYIGNDTFHDCDRLTSVTIGNGVTSIGDDAFLGCDRLTSVTIGNGVTSIGDYAFDYCESLTSITIPDSVTYIGEWAFYCCYELASVTIGNGVTSISNSAFADCHNLTSVTIGNGVTSIGNSAFADCHNLTSVTIGNAVTSIDYYAFWSCDKLTTVYFKGTADEWNSIRMYSYNTALTSATRYYYSEKEPSEEGNYWHYDGDGNIVIWG